MLILGDMLTLYTLKRYKLTGHGGHSAILAYTQRKLK